MSQPPMTVDDAFEAAALAIRADDLGLVASLLNEHQRLATHIAASGHPSLLQLVACEDQQLAAPEIFAQLLLDAGSVGEGPLVAAAGCNGQRTLQTLLDAGIDVDARASNGWTPLDEALYWHQPDSVTTLLDRGASLGRLRRAAGIGDLALIATFFTDGAVAAEAGPIQSPFPGSVADDDAMDPQMIVDHAFVLAVNCGQQASAHALLDHGANVNAIPVGYHWQGTALHAAIWRGHTTIVEWLLASGADPTIRDGLAHSDAAGWARHHKRPAIVDVLARDGRSE